MGNDPPRPVPVPLDPLARHDRSAVALLARVLALAVVLVGLFGAPALAAGATTQTPTPAPASSGPPSGGSGEAVRGTLNNAGERVVGATVTVLQGETEVGTATTDEKGQFSIPLPGPGEYTVVLDTATLPEGVEVREDGGDRLTLNVRPGSKAGALFLLGEGGRDTSSKARQAAQLFVGGLQYGLVIAMAAIGLSLIFGTTGLTNFAHGELVTGGALLAYFFNQVVGLNLILAALLAVGVGGVLGGLLDRGLWRPLRKRGTGLIAALVVSIGLALLLRYAYLYIFGGGSRSYAQYATQPPVQLGPVSLPPRDLVIIAISILVLVGVGLALQRTKLGKATRAVADNPSLAASSGIDVDRVINVVWVAGTALAVLGGVFLALSQQVGFLLGFNILLLLFAGVTLGGLGTAFGALVGSLVIGLFTQLSTLVIPAELQNVGALLVLILILVFRPQGILGRAERVG